MLSASADKGEFCLFSTSVECFVGILWQTHACFQRAASSWRKKVISRLFRVHDLFADCLCCIKLSSSSSISPEDGVPRSRTWRCGWKSGSWPQQHAPLPVFSSPFLLPSAPPSKSRTTVKVITMKNFSACIYGASQSCSAKSRTGNITSPWHVLFTRICNVARRFISTASPRRAHLLIWILIAEPFCCFYRSLTLIHCSAPFLAFPIRSITFLPFHDCVEDRTSRNSPNLSVDKTFHCHYVTMHCRLSFMLWLSELPTGQSKQTGPVPQTHRGSECGRFTAVSQIQSFDSW